MASKAIAKRAEISVPMDPISKDPKLMRYLFRKSTPTRSELTLSIMKWAATKNNLELKIVERSIDARIAALKRPVAKPDLKITHSKKGRPKLPRKKIEKKAEQVSPKPKKAPLTIEEERARRTAYMRLFRARTHPKKVFPKLPEELQRLLFDKMLEAARLGPRNGRAAENKRLMLTLSEKYGLDNTRIGRLIGVSETAVSQTLIALGRRKIGSKAPSPWAAAEYGLAFTYDPYVVAQPSRTSPDSKRAIITPVDEFMMVSFKARDFNAKQIANMLDLSPVTVSDRLMALGMSQKRYEKYAHQVDSMLEQGMSQRAIERALGFKPRSLSTFLARRSKSTEGMPDKDALVEAIA